MLLFMEFSAEALKQHSEIFLNVSDKRPSINDVGKATEEANMKISNHTLFYFYFFFHSSWLLNGWLDYNGFPLQLHFSLEPCGKKSYCTVINYDYP